MSWPAYLINLAPNTIRLEAAAAQFAAQNITWQRIEGVNGWQMGEDETAKVYDHAANAARAKAPLVPPEVGCYLSHIAAWRAIAGGAAEGGFIFEDDFRADDTLAAKMAALSGDSAHWDMVKLFAFKPDAPGRNHRQIAPGVEVFEPFRVPTCLIGYGMTKAAARHLADRAIPFFRPVDEDQKWTWETGLRVALITPPPVLVGNQEAATGTIGTARRRASTRSARQVLRGLRYQLRYNLGLLWHRRIMGR